MPDQKIPSIPGLFNNEKQGNIPSIPGLFEQKQPGFVEKAGLGLASGTLNTVGGVIRGIPTVFGTLYDAAATPQNLLADWFNADWLKANYSEFANSPYNPLSYVDKAGKAILDFGEQLNPMKNYSTDILGSIKQGNYAQAGEQAIMALFVNAPQYAAAVLSLLAGNPSVGLGVLGASATGNKYHALENANLSDELKRQNAVFDGINEILWEKYFTVPMLEDAMKNPAVKKQVQNGIVSGLKRMGIIGVDALKEGLSEAGTQITSNLLDRSTNVRNVNGELPGVFDGAFDAALVGALMGAGTGTVQVGREYLAGRKPAPSISPTPSNHTIDPIYQKAVELVRVNGASPNMLQQQLNIGYPQAMQYINQMQKEGIINPLRPEAKRPEALRPELIGQKITLPQLNIINNDSLRPNIERPEIQRPTITPIQTLPPATVPEQEIAQSIVTPVPADSTPATSETNSLESKTPKVQFQEGQTVVLNNPNKEPQLVKVRKVFSRTVRVIDESGKVLNGIPLDWISVQTDGFQQSHSQESKPANNPNLTESIPGMNKPVVTTEQVETSFDETQEAISEPIKSQANQTVEMPATQLNQEVTDDRSPSRKIADSIKDYLSRAEQGHSLDNMGLYKISDQAFGGTQAEGKYTSKDAYDAMELGINQFLLESGMAKTTGKSQNEANHDIHEIEDKILSRIPTQTKRTGEQIEFQQFSTPPSLAYTAAWVANITPEDSVLEPSAGIGGLAVFAKANGAKVIVNELSERRAGLLKELNFDELYQENAEQLHNILPDSIQPTVVLMNPPFSTTAGRMEGKKSTSFATKHIEQALLRLQPGGRLVAIVGKGMSDDAPKFKSWWNQIKSEYNVLANISMDGKNYQKYGTTFDNQLLVIDKNGSTEKTITDKVSNFEEITSLLEGIRNARFDSGRRVEQTPAQSTSEEVTVKSDRRKSRPLDSVSSPTDRVGSKTERQKKPQRGTVSSGLDGDTGLPKVSSVPTESNGSTDEGRGVGDQVQRTEEDGERNGRSDVPSEQINDNSLGEGTVEVKSERKKKSQLSDAVYTKYEPAKLKIEGARPHPGDLAQSAAMDAVEPPDVHYKPNLPKELITSGGLSIAQLEAIVYAGQAHQTVLPDGTRKGFFIGDGTGVGKGREIAGILLDNFRQGRRKSVWISMNDSLFSDAKRDVEAIFGTSDMLYDFGKVKPGESIKQKEGILFVTYGRLGTGLEVVGSKELKVKDKSARINQIVEWLGKDFDGVIAFDEAHHMQNCLGSKGKRGQQKASLKGIAGLELQKQLPKARVIYVSATGATEVRNLAYAERLGLWGKGTPFAGREDFVNKIEAGGLAAMELVARDMKANGSYIARSLGYDNVTYKTIEHQLTKEQVHIYDQLAKGWQLVFQNIERALEVTGQHNSGMARGRAIAQFWSAQQRFFNQILTSMQMPSAISAIKKDLEDGKAIVLQLVNTNEASMNREMVKIQEEELPLEDIDLTPRSIPLQYLEKCFPVEQYEEYMDELGNIKSRLVHDKNGNPVINKQAVELRDKLIADLGSLRVPEGPLEYILNTFGPEKVAEVTGRSRRVVRVKDPETGREKMVEEKRSKRHNDVDVKAFMDDEKQILIFSDAGGTGKSYHADLNAKNQRKRVHYLIQPGWRADSAVQGFGRTHRSNEASAPEYRLITTNLKGQKRFISSIARRLDQLGALTKGQRQTGSQGLFNASDNLESPIARDALHQFYKDLVAGQIDGLDTQETLQKMGLTGLLDEHGKLREDEATRDITRFLNRLLALESDLQNRVFDAFEARYEDFISQAQKIGALDQGLENFKADKVKRLKETTIKTYESGGSTKYIEFEAYHKTRAVSFEEILSRNLGKKVGFFVNKRSNNIRFVVEGPTMTTDSGSIVSTYRFFGQEAGVGYDRLTEAEMKASFWEKVSEEEAQEKWEEAVSQIPEYKTEKVYLISGSLLPIWDKLPQNHVRVMRVLTEDGEIYLGRLINEREISSTLARLGVDREKEAIDTSNLAHKILEEKYTVELSNGWKIARSRVSGEYRLELFGSDLHKYQKELTESGVNMELIQFKPRYFIPVGEKAQSVIEQLTKYRPVADLIAPDTVRALKRASKREKQFTHGNAQPITRQEIENYINIEFEIPLRQGRLSMRKTKAEYNLEEEVLRLRDYSDYESAAHEIGHHLIKKLDLDIKAYRELPALLDAMGLKQEYKKVLWHEEGAAEFFRLYFTDPAEAELMAPNFYAYVEKVLDHDEYGAKVRGLQDMLYRWYNQAPEERVRGSIAKKPMEQRKFLSVQDKLLSFFVDEDVPLQKALKEAGVDWESLDIANNPIKLKRLLRSVDDAIYVMLTKFAFDANYQRTGKSLRDILLPVARYIGDEKSIGDFETYILAKHALEREYKLMVREYRQNNRNPLEKLSDEDILERLPTTGSEHQATGINLKDLEETVKKYERPEFLTALKELQTFQDNLLAYLVDKDMLSSKSARAISEAYEYHIPLYRLFGEENTTVESALGKRLANLPTPIKRAYGSTRIIQDPLRGIVQDTVYALREGGKNEVAIKFIDAIKGSLGAGYLVNSIPKPKTVTKFVLSQISKDLQKAGVPKKVLKKIDLEALATVYGKVTYPGFKEKRENIVTIRRNGEVEFYQLHPDVYRALQGLDSSSAGVLGTLLKPLEWVTNVFKAGSVIAPKFPLKNVVRDQFTSVLYDKWGFKPVVNFVEGLFSVTGVENPDELWKVAGGSRSGFYNLLKDIESPDTVAKLLKKEKFIMNPFTWLSRISQASDDATRRGFFLQQLKGVDLNRLTAKEFREKVMEAAYNSRGGINIDYGVKGYGSRAIDRYIPFFSAGVNELNMFLKRYKEEPLKMTIKGLLYITLPSILIYLANRDKDEWRELPQWRKDYFWNLIDGNGNVWSIPKPFLPGLIFGTVPERVLEYIDSKDSRKITDLASSFSTMGLPNMTVVSVAPMVELWANRDDLGDPIIPPSELDRLPAEQYGMYTSEVAKYLGKVFNCSPRQIDHLIKSYGSSLGGDLLTFTNFVAGAKDFQQTIRDTFGLVQEGFRSPQSIDRVYEERDKHQNIVDTFNYQRRTGKQPTIHIKEYLAAKRNVAILNGAIKRLSLLRKRQDNENVKEKMVSVAQEALKQIK